MICAVTASLGATMSVPLHRTERRTRVPRAGITVHCVHDNACQPYAEHMWNNALRLASEPGELLFQRHVPPARGSTGHALGIRAALEAADPERINIIADADTVLLRHGWDFTLRMLLLNAGIVGTTYEDIGSSCSGAGQLQTYKRKPNFTWIAWAPGVDLRHDTMPSKGSQPRIIDEAMSQLYNLPIGSKLLCDASWRFPEHLERMKLGYRCLQNHRLRSFPGCEALSDSHEVYSLSLRSSESEHTLDDVPFLAHQRSASMIVYMTGISRSFYKSVEKCWPWQLASPGSPGDLRSCLSGTNTVPT